MAAQPLPSGAPPLPSGAAFPRLIAIDIDGTVLGPDGKVSRRTRAALQAAGRRGCQVVLATGRPLRTAVPVAADLGIADTVVAYNGAAMLWCGEFRLVSELSAEAATAAIVRLRARFPGVTLALEAEDGWFLEPAVGVDASAPAGHVAHLFRGGPPSAVGPLEAFLGRTRIKLNAVHEQLHPSQLAAELGGLDLVGMWSLPFLLEMHDKGVDKSTALAWLCRQAGIEAADVAAFGDQQNDAGMLAWAGVGVAMGNSEPEALEAADYLTASNAEDGVALVVEGWLGGAADPSGLAAALPRTVDGAGGRAGGAAARSEVLD